MKITRKDFFETAVSILFRERSQGNCSYQEAIINAQKELKLTNEQLKELCSKDVQEINIGRTKA